MSYPFLHAWMSIADGEVLGRRRRRSGVAGGGFASGALLSEWSQPDCLSCGGFADSCGGELGGGESLAFDDVVEVSWVAVLVEEVLPAHQASFADHPVEVSNELDLTAGGHCRCQAAGGAKLDGSLGTGWDF